MRRLMLSLLVVMLFPAVAMAGGWATVGLDSTPASVKPGDKWTPTIEVLQHGQTPLEGVEPAVVIIDAAGKETRFAATPTDKPGFYRVEVVFPKAGRYDYKVDDGFGNAGNPAMHAFGAVTIGGPAAVAPPAARPTPAPDDGAFPWLTVLLAAFGAAVPAAIAIAMMRRRRGPITA